MEPKLSAPNRGPEHLPDITGGSVERIPSVPTPEKRGEMGHERGEERKEGESPAVPQAILPPVQITTVAPAVDDVTAVPADSTPLVAADDDLIEKEWVEKAKAIVVKTKDDPYQREQEVGKLQADYLRKRYGKELGAS